MTQVRRVRTERLEELTVLSSLGFVKLNLKIGIKLDTHSRVEVIQTMDEAEVTTLGFNPDMNRVVHHRTYTREQLGDREALVLKSDVPVEPADRFYAKTVAEYEDLMGMKRGEAIK